MDKKGVGTVGILLFLAIFGVGMGAVPTLEHHVAVQEYEPTEATILSTDVAVKVDSDGDRSYRPDITYEYAIEGQTYSQNNVFPGRFTRWSGNQSWAQDVSNQYQPGDRVTVYHNPANPEQAYLQNDGMPFVWYFGMGYAAIAIGSGVWFVRVGFKRHRHRVLIRDTPTEQAQSLSIGPSEIKGTAVPTDEPMSAPFSETDCVVASYEIEEYDDDDDDGGWKTIDQGVLHQPFSVDDGTGSVLVRPHDDTMYDLDPDDWSTTYVDSSSRGPPPIQEFVTKRTNVGFPSHKRGRGNDRKYKQNLIRTDESVYVFGTVHPREESTSGRRNADRLVVKKTDPDSPLSEPLFLISDDTEQNLINRRRWALWRLPVGGFFVIVGFATALLIVAPFLGIPVPVLF